MMANDNLTKPREAAGKALAQGGKTACARS
jgi:hypothetical protein